MRIKEVIYELVENTYSIASPESYLFVYYRLRYVYSGILLQKAIQEKDHETNGDANN